MRRENFGSYLTVNNRGERIRLFIPPKPPVSSDLSFSAEERKTLASALFELGKLEGTTNFSEIGEKLWNLNRIREFAASISLEEFESDVRDYLLDRCEPKPSGPSDAYQGQLKSSIQEFERLLSSFQTKPLDRVDYWRMIERNLTVGNQEAPSPPRFVGLGGFGPASMPPPKEEVDAGLAGLTDHLFQNRLKLDPIDSVAILYGVIWMLNPYGEMTGLVARSISLAILHREGLMRNSVINLSSAIRDNEHRLNESLSLLRNTGDWEAWIAGFAELLMDAARRTYSFNIEVGRLYFEGRVRASSLGRASESIHRIIDIVFDAPVFTSNFLVAKTGLTAATVNKSLQHMVDLGIVRETTSRKRNRVFQHEELMKLIAGN